MDNVISLREYMLKKDLELAKSKLSEARYLISVGHNELVPQAKSLEDMIKRIEEELLHMIEEGII
jgi:hypothetical protein